ncbi:MAG: glycosyltransferase family 2 protein [Planctomycetota bacterium]|nr:glycosyltransferase family 2 protein [Planctomycetota bacterium]
MTDLSVPRVEPLSDSELPRVAIVILNWNGRHHLAGCFDSLRALDYSQDRVQVVLIDNGSDDGSVEHVDADYPWVKLENNPRNVGFSAGCNQGAQLADDPEVLVFLNNDMRVEPDFLRQLVAPVVRGKCVATTGRMMSWDGKVLNSAGGGMNWHGIGIQRGLDQPLRDDYDQPRKTLFACGGAMAMDAEVFEEVGGFDEEFFAYYEDVDLGWRTWVLGHEVHYVPDAVCYHHHSSTSRRVPTERLRLLQVRNPMLACFKNYGEDNLRRVLPGMLALATRRALLATGIQSLDQYRIEHLTHLRPPGVLRRWLDRLRGNTDGAERVRRVGMADLIGINDLLGRWDHWSERRAQIQALRKRSDDEILPLFLHPLWCIEKDPAYEELHAGLEGFLELDRLFAGLTNLEDPPA